MRFPIWLTIIAALLGLALVFVLGSLLIRPPLALILEAGFTDEMISPNADGDNDITRFRYELSRNARVSLILEAEDGREFFFRQEQPRSARDYEVLFSAVVDGYVNEGDNLALSFDNNPQALVVERRLLPDGVYTWRLIAENDDEREELSGILTIQDADSPLPIMTTFTLSTDVFTPNRDGVNDRVIINIFLEKAADLRVFLLTEDGIELPIVEREEWSRPDGEAGRYTFDYEGGVDLNQEPPPDGSYRIIALAQDDEGQRIRREATLTIERGGVPRAEISPQAVDADVFWTSEVYLAEYYSDNESLGELIPKPNIPEAVSVTLAPVPYGNLLVFRLTVDNYSDVPIRTTSPPSGAVYQQSQVSAALDALDEPGAWRVGIQCDTSEVSFPYRWAIGSDEDLITINDPETGREYRYLPARTRSVVWGAVRMTEINEFANPQTCWAGLIHEGVNISVENRFVNPIEVLIGAP
jgi:hypothetical protein